MKKRYFLFALALISTTILLGYHASNHIQINPLVMENVEALTEFEIIDGQIVSEDEIPCASGVNKLMIHMSYINCEDCKIDTGQGREPFGTCTKIRFTKLP